MAASSRTSLGHLLIPWLSASLGIGFALGCGGTPPSNTLPVELPTVTGTPGAAGSGVGAGSAGAAATGSGTVTEPDLGTMFTGPEMDRVTTMVIPDLVDWAGTPVTTQVSFEGCGGTAEAAETLIRPVDIIFVIDNSSSMTDEIEQVQLRINNDLADVIAMSGVDYRVIMVARYGQFGEAIGESDNPICVGGALGGQDCSDPVNTPLVNQERFFHYSADIGSREPWCRLLEGFGNPDELANDGRDWTPLAPNGWSQFLRPESQKSFVVITDDNSSCGAGQDIGFGGGGGGGNRYQDVNGMPFNYSFDDATDPVGAAQAFDTALLELSPEHFGTALARKYKWFSIVGMLNNEPATSPWTPEQAIQQGLCECPAGVVTADGQECSVGPGTGFQALSNLTGGLRYPICNTDNYNGIFQAIAEVIKEGAVSCNYSIDTNGDVLNKDKVNFVFTNSTGQKKLGYWVAGPESCSLGGWYFDDPTSPTQVVACTQTCEEMQADTSAQVNLVYGCDTIVP